MGFLDLTNGSETNDDQVTDGDDVPSDVEAESGPNRRWLFIAGLVALAAVAYLVSRKRAAREAEFTEIELEPVDSDAESESESESASTE
jgi:type VI protein secretion system component VasK